MAPQSGRARITRGLRFRLTAGYALFFSLFLIGISVLLRARLASTLDVQSREVLEQEWAALKGYLRVEKNQPIWFYDRYDPDEAFIVNRLQRVYMLAEANGTVRESSDLYRSIGLDSPEEIQAVIRSSHPVWKRVRNRQGIPFLIRSGVIYDEGHKKPYFVAIGRSLAEYDQILNEYTWIYVGVIPALILCACLLGWFLARRALAPVIAVADAAQRLSGSNLSLRIPTRGAGDELDYLIATFNAMIERLEASFQQIRQFSIDVSHELRTPITAIRGQLEVALFTARTPEQYREAVLNALQDVERMSQIVRALLLLSQGESGQLVLQKTRLDVSEAARELVEQFQIPAEAAQLQLTADVKPGCYAEADRVQMGRMLTNLLSNAMKFTPAGGWVRVSVRDSDSGIEVVVEDSGCGIPEQHLPHIFDRFYRVPRQTGSSPDSGLGLGLSFVAWIVKAHNGRISVRSVPGSGSRFTVALPAAAVPEQHAESASRHEGSLIPAWPVLNCFGISWYQCRCY